MAVGIYRIKNLITERSYVGQSHNIKRRFNQHRNRAFNFSNKQYYDSCYCDIRRYGIDNFVFEILEECPSADLDVREVFWINHFDAYKNGYNQTKGGEAEWHYAILSDEKLEEIIALLREANLSNSEIGARYGVSDQTISNINMGRSCIKDNTLYPIRSRSGKEITAKAIRCFDCSGLKQRKVVRPDKEQLFDFVKQNNFVLAGKQFGVSDNVIRKWCVHYGILNLLRKKKKENVLPKEKHDSRKPINQLDGKTKAFIATHESIRAAGRATGVKRSNIFEVCSGRRKTAKGFCWEYAS